MPETEIPSAMGLASYWQWLSYTMPMSADIQCQAGLTRALFRHWTLPQYSMYKRYINYKSVKTEIKKIFQALSSMTIHAIQIWLIIKERLHRLFRLRWLKLNFFSWEWHFHLNRVRDSMSMLVRMCKSVNLQKSFWKQISSYQACSETCLLCTLYIVITNVEVN